MLTGTAAGHAGAFERGLAARAMTRQGLAEPQPAIPTAAGWHARTRCRPGLRAAARTVAHGPELAQLRAAVNAATPGAAYMLGKRLQQRAAAAVEPLLHRAARSTRAALGEHARTVREAALSDG